MHPTVKRALVSEGPTVGPNAGARCRPEELVRDWPKILIEILRDIFSLPSYALLGIVRLPGD